MLVSISALSQDAPVRKDFGPDGTVIYTDKGTRNLPAPIPKAKPQPATAVSSSRSLDKAMNAAMKIFAWEIVVESAYQFCRSEESHLANNLKTAKDEWMTLNATLRQKKDAVLRDNFSADELRLVSARAQQESNSVLSLVKAAPAAAKTKWCQEAAAQFFGPQLNPIANPSLAGDIMNFQPNHVQKAIQ